MISRLLLVKAITLLYLESKQTNKATNSADLVKSALATIKLPETAIIGDFSKDPVVTLKDTAKWMATNPVDHTYDKNELLQKLRVESGHDETIYLALVEGIDFECGEDRLKLICIDHRNALRDHLREFQVAEICKKASLSTSLHAGNVDWRHFVDDLITQLEPFRPSNSGESGHPGIVNAVKFTDIEAIGDVISRGVDELDTRGILKFGLQGFNRLFGSNGGARRGEMLVIGALQHNYKSGTTLDMFRTTALYNKPYMRDETKKPLILRISFENPLSLDIINLYKSLVEIETGVFLDPREIDYHHAANYVTEFLQRTGYTVAMMQIDPSEFTYRDLFDVMEKLEADGYEIHELNVDYLAMMSKKGCAQGPAGVEIRDLFRRTRNFIAKRGTFTVTPHQLSTEAKQLTRMGVENLTREIANKGYYDGCRTIDQEVDMEIYQHIVKLNGESWLEWQRGKHRKTGITRTEDMHCAYKFCEVGTLPDDVLGQDMSCPHVGGKPMSEGGEAAWFSGV